jgi:hypothetical protein
MRIVEAGEHKLVFERVLADERLLCTFNLSDRPCEFQCSGTELISVGDVDGATLGGYAAVIEEMA